MYAVAPGAEPIELPLGSSPADRRERARILARAGTIREIVLAYPPSMPVGDVVRQMVGLSARDVTSFVITPDAAPLSQAMAPR